MLYNDILRECLPYNYRRGLDLCEEIYNTENWKKTTESSNLPIEINLTGNFIAEDELNVFLRTKDGSIIYPTSSSIPELVAVTNYYKKELLTQGALKKLVAENRRNSSGKQFIYTFNIPASYSYDKSFMLEINRSCKTVAVSSVEPDDGENLEFKAEIQSQKKPKIATLDGDEVLNAAPLRVEVGVAIPSDDYKKPSVSGETFSVRMLKQELDRRTLIPINRTGSIYYNDNQLRQVENLYQHVLNNTYEYSRSVWEGLSDGERVMMTVSVAQLRGRTFTVRHLWQQPYTAVLHPGRRGSGEESVEGVRNRKTLQRTAARSHLQALRHQLPRTHGRSVHSYTRYDWRGCARRDKRERTYRHHKVLELEGF